MTTAMKLADLPTDRTTQAHYQLESHKHNVISTEVIAIYSVTTSVLWTQSYMLGHTFSTDGKTNNTGTTVYWWYTPPTSTLRTDNVTPKNNVDLGWQALLETANICYGGALMIFAAILFMRSVTNTAILHPKHRTGEPGVVYFETTMLATAFLATLAGMVATALGMEPKTGWAVFALGVSSIVGFAVSYHWEQARITGDDPLEPISGTFDIIPPGGTWQTAPKKEALESEPRSGVTLAPLGVHGSGV